MDNPKVSILIPSAYRPVKLERCLASFYAAACPVPVEVLVSVMEDDERSLHVLRRYPIDFIRKQGASEYPGGAAEAWRKLSKAARGEWLMLGADDQVAAPDWLIEAWKCVKELGKPGVIGLNDLHSDGNEYAALYMVHRDFLAQHCGGYFIYPGYRSWWFDREITDIGMREGAYLWAVKSEVEHRHEDWLPAEHDKTYDDSKPYRAADKLLYETRKANNFPADWPHG